MYDITSPIFHGMQAALGAGKYDVENGCIDAWNCIENNIRRENIENVDLSKRGYDNFYVELGKYATRLASYYVNLTKMNGNKEPEEIYDGLFSLDVSAAFGEWFAKFVMENKCAPEEHVGMTAIEELVEEYTSNPAVMIELNPEKFPKLQ